MPYYGRGQEKRGKGTTAALVKAIQVSCTSLPGSKGWMDIRREETGERREEEIGE